MEDQQTGPPLALARDLVRCRTQMKKHLQGEHEQQGLILSEHRDYVTVPWSWAVAGLAPDVHSCTREANPASAGKATHWRLYF